MGRYQAIKVLVRPLVVVVGEVLGEELTQLVPIHWAVAIDALLLDAPPEPFDEGIVGGTALSVHAHFDALLEQSIGEQVTGVLAALVGVEDPRGRVLKECAMLSFQTKGGVLGV